MSFSPNDGGTVLTIYFYAVSDRSHPLRSKDLFRYIGSTKTVPYYSVYRFLVSLSPFSFYYINVNRCFSLTESS